MLGAVTVELGQIAPVLIAFATGFVWLLRIEGRVNMNQKDNKANAEKAAQLEQKIAENGKAVQEQATKMAGGEERFKHIDETLIDIKKSLQTLVNRNAK